MTEQNTEIEILNYTKPFNEVCNETLSNRNEIPEHIIDLATRVHRAKNLKVVLRNAKENKFKQTIQKAQNLASKAALIKSITTKNCGVM